MEDTVQQFANLHHLRVKRDSCADPIIAGKRTIDTDDGDRDRPEYRNHIFENGDGRLGVCLMFDTPRAWTFAKQKLLAAGLVLRQNGDTEGTLLFDPKDPRQVRLAIKVTGARAKRVLSPAQREVLDRARKAPRPSKTSPILCAEG